MLWATRERCYGPPVWEHNTVPVQVPCQEVVYGKTPAEPLSLVLGYTTTVSGDRGALQVPCVTIASGAGIYNNGI